MLARRWKEVSKAEEGTWVFGDDNLISFSYTAIQTMGNSLQKLHLKNLVEIHPKKNTKKPLFRKFNTNPAQVFI